MSSPPALPDDVGLTWLDISLPADVRAVEFDTVKVLPDVIETPVLVSETRGVVEIVSLVPGREDSGSVVVSEDLTEDTVEVSEVMLVMEVSKESEVMGIGSVTM